MSSSPTGPAATSPPSSPPLEELSSPLLEEHRAAGATLTSFAGWSMPLRYGSDLAEHRAVREAAGLFDLSHMAQVAVTGGGAAQALDRALVSAVSALPSGRARYTMLTAEDGGVLDDLVVYRRRADSFLVVANAANRQVVLRELTLRGQGLPAVVQDRTAASCLIAIQGPRAREVLEPLTDVDLGGLRYYTAASGLVCAHPALVARTGYTGEDGFELSLPAEAAVDVWRTVLATGTPSGLVPCGLAARDTLRLEAGMALYGHELTTDVTPFDVGLGRLVDLDHEFVGRPALAARASAPAGRTLVGLLGTGRRAARAGNQVLLEGVPVGAVTSGALSPTLGRPVAMALLHHAPPVGASVDVDVRGSRQPMEIVALPFYSRRRAAALSQPRTQEAP